MAKKKKAKKTAKKTGAAKKKAPAVAKKKQPKRLPTRFLREFDSSVITRDNTPRNKPRLWAWPPAGRGPPDLL